MNPNLAVAFLLTSSVVLILAPLSAGEVAPGDDREAVLEALGKPLGRVGSDDFQILHFDRGAVHLRNGVVERVELISEEEAEARQREREERRRERERKEEERIAEGKALRDEKLADESFAERPPSERLAFWRTFVRHYPEVDVSFQIEVARAELQEEERIRREEEQREERLIAMQERVRQAEARAAEAEAQAREAEEEQRRSRYRRTVVYTTPTHIVWPHDPKPDKKPDEPRTREQPRFHEDTPNELSPFERARQYRLERSRHSPISREESTPAPNRREGNGAIGQPEREPSAFDRAREYRLERSQRLSNLRQRSS